MKSRLVAWPGPALGGVAVIGLLVFAGERGTEAARGWLCAFVLISMVPIGSLALLLVHGISGGRWGGDLAPVLVPAARCLPLLLVAVLPVLLFRPLIYHWTELDTPADVRRYYLNPPFFDARTVIALLAWSGLAWFGVWRSKLFAALGLTMHLILLTFIPSDWVLTIQPGSISAGFGLGFGIEQMFAALAFTAVLAPAGRDPRANRDLAGMMATALLATMYFIYMEFLVSWYGNIPVQVHWYTVRTAVAWPTLAMIAFLIGVALPFVAILNSFVRRDAGALRVVGGMVLVGAALHVAWLVAPAFGAISLIPAALAAAALAFLIMAAACIPPIAGAAHEQ